MKNAHGGSGTERDRRTTKFGERCMNSNGSGSLKGQVAVVTGAGRGIGAAIALRLAGLGANVVLCGRTLKTLQATAEGIAAEGGRAEAVTCDVRDLGSVQTLAAKVEQ